VWATALEERRSNYPPYTKTSIYVDAKRTLESVTGYLWVLAKQHQVIQELTKAITQALDSPLFE